ncbi:MAG TPA: hydroxylamine reductase [Armatimonadota bacterium]|nr:hydroxylamine reductase [Armatimonadota bacterium]
MFCYQCEQTVNGTGCLTVGNCGKDADTAALQDILMYTARIAARYAHRARQLGASDKSVDIFIIEALFTTVTNVAFDPERLVQDIHRGADMAVAAKRMYDAACEARGVTPEELPCPRVCDLKTDKDTLLKMADKYGLETRCSIVGKDAMGLQELMTYGLKGAAAYLEHARMLGYEDDSLYAAIVEGLSFVESEPTDVPTLLEKCLWVGEINLKVMALLDQANTGAYGDPVPTEVNVNPVPGKAIVVSGHDLKDLEALLEQTAGKGINVYTHGEMLPAHGYPKLKAYPHLVGNYGGAWQVQGTEFKAFPGAILMTTNCIQRPATDYADRIFTCGLVSWPGVKHISDRDFTPVIESALAAPGFTQEMPEKRILVGFGRNTLLSNAEAILKGFSEGKLRHIFLIGGCDGALHGRNYYTELATSVPDDCLVMTLACGKYRFNKLEFGTAAGFPRLLDVGQCNDAYSAIVTASALADALNCGVNDLPLSLVLSWYEQKAVAVLLTLLHLGIKNIRLGPTLPAFLTPAAVQVLVDMFNIQPTTTADQDLKAILG